MNQFESSASNAILRHGVSCTYKILQVGTYDTATSKVVNTEISKTIIAYKKSVKVNQFSYPNLIGKEVAMFYVLASDVASPNVGDHIVFNGKSFKVDSYQSHSASGKVIVHRIIGVI